MSRLGDAELARFRLRNVGIVFQFHNLIPDLDVLDNAALPLVMAGMEVGEARRRGPSCWPGWAWATGSTTCRTS